MLLPGSCSTMVDKCHFFATFPFFSRFSSKFSRGAALVGGECWAEGSGNFAREFILEPDLEHVHPRSKQQCRVGTRAALILHASQLLRSKHDLVHEIEREGCRFLCAFTLSTLTWYLKCERWAETARRESVNLLCCAAEKNSNSNGNLSQQLTLSSGTGLITCLGTRIMVCSDSYGVDVSCLASKGNSRSINC